MVTACSAHEPAVHSEGPRTPSISKRSSPKNPWVDGDPAAWQPARIPGMILSEGQADGCWDGPQAGCPPFWKQSVALTHCHTSSPPQTGHIVTMHSIFYTFTLSHTHSHISHTHFHISLTYCHTLSLTFPWSYPFPGCHTFSVTYIQCLTLLHRYTHILTNTHSSVFSVLYNCQNLMKCFMHMVT